MDWRDWALVAAGVIGCAVAVAHGLILQRIMVRPLHAMLDSAGRMRAARRLLAPMLHFTTVFWFAGGLALIAAAASADRGARLATAVLVGGAYLFGAVGNFWASQGRHPGWVLYAAAVVLIAAALAGPV
ncbi:hypothetical protein [Phenylobacterium sp.]|jgi:hypothetical protein|uniref:hypothetical protein n=1 Tax=Phenylobacterium sp. TaxID=1871053 RepID=UPI002F942EDA